MESRVESPALVGRHDAVTALMSRLSAAERHESSLTWLGGEAGVGKTRLLQEIQRRASERGMRVLRGECIQLSGGEFPYAPVVGALRSVERECITAALNVLPDDGRREITRLVPELAVASRETPPQDGGDYAQFRLFELLLGLLRLLGDQAPLLFIIEDAHWADTSTRDFISYTAHNLAADPLALVVSFRSEEATRQHPLAALLNESERRQQCLRLDVPRLSRDETELQLDAILGRPAERELVDDIFRRSEGNPLYVEELLAARLSGRVYELPQTTRDALLMRIDALPEDSVRVLRALTAVGRPASPELLSAGCGIAEPMLSSALRAALNAQVIYRRREDDRFEFRHALMREALAEDLMPGEWRALHEAIARALAAAGQANAAELAFHWEAAGQCRSALSARIEAGIQAERLYAFTEARQHFGVALKLFDDVGSPDEGAALDRVELLRRQAETTRLTGDCEEAADLCRQALAGIDAGAQPLRAAALHERLGAYLFWDDEAALAAYEEGLRLLPDGCDAERARLLSASALALHNQMRWSEAREYGEHALRLAQHANAAAEEAHAHLTLGTTMAFLGDPESGERHARRAREIAEAHGWAELRARVFSHLAEVLRIRGRTSAALDVMLEGERMMGRLGMSGSFGNSMSVNAVEDLLWLGRWDDAAELLAKVKRLQLRLGAQLLRHTLAGRLAAARGDGGAAREHLGQARAMLSAETATDFATGVYAGFAELALTEFRPDDAQREVAAALETIGPAPDPLYAPVLYALGCRAAADAAERARAVGGRDDVGRLEALVCELIAGLERVIANHALLVEPVTAVAHRSLCEAELTRLQRRASPELWERAAELWTALERPHPAVYAQWRQGEALLQRDGGRADAAGVLNGALATAQSMGARPLAEEIDALLRAARLPRSTDEPAPTASRQPAAENAGLTAREVEVLALVAEGQTNREIAERLYISDRTAAVHVSHILRKLGVVRRTGAATAAHRLGLLDIPALDD